MNGFLKKKEKQKKKKKQKKSKKGYILKIKKMLISIKISGDTKKTYW